MLELRILSGIHRGAILSLDDSIQEHYNIGSYEYADMLLLDPGILEQHFELRYENGAWLLYAHGEIREENGKFLISPKSLARLQKMYVAGIWLGVAHHDDAWDCLEPLPSNDFMHEKPLDMQQFLQQAPIESTVEFKEPVSKVDFKSRMMALIGLLSLAGWATANVFLDANAVKPLPNVQSPNTEQVVQKKQTHTPPVQTHYTREALAGLFDQKMMELDLKKYLSYTYTPEGWEISTSLDEEDRLRLDRAIEAFTQNYQPKFAIHVRNIAKKDLLNIQVSQVIYGKLAGIVTQDGERIFIGDEIHGYKLIAIQNQKAIFDGPQKIELNL